MTTCKMRRMTDATAWNMFVSAAKESLNKSAAALSGSFAATFRFENLEIHKVFLRFSNLDLRQNLSLSALADLFRASLKKCVDIYNIVTNFGGICQ